MAELVDALASGASTRKGVEVRVLFWAPIKNKEYSMKKNTFFRYLFFFLFVFSFPFFPLFLSNKQISERENRMLAQWPVFFKDKQFNFSFGTDLDNYLKDHFPFRDQLITTYHNGIFLVNRRIENKLAISGKDGWIFYKNNAFRNLYYKKSELEKILEKLNKLNSLLKKNGITFIILVCPSQQRVYSEYIKDYYDIEQFPNKALELKENVKKKTDVSFFYPLDEMRAQSHSYPYPLYQKCDAHPSGYGYYALYRLLMNELKKTYPSLNVLDKNNFYEVEYIGVGSACRSVGLYNSRKMFPNLTLKKKYQVKSQKRGEHAYWTNISNGKYNLFFLGSSMGSKIHKMMTPSFKKIIFMRDNIEKQPDNNEDIFPELFKILLDEDIDIFVLEMPEDRIITHRFVERLDDILKSYEN